MVNVAASKVALIGARGHTGGELIRLLARHPHFELAALSSRKLVGRPLSDLVPDVSLPLEFENLTPEDVARRDIDVWVLALPNGLSRPWVDAIDAKGDASVIIDLSSDHRFDQTWTYGLPEVTRDKLIHANRVANPGCYATGAQLALSPIVDLLSGAPTIFGVSGYSGAGTTPSPKNDPQQLRDNLMPYALSGHTHELEIRWHLGHPVYFMPHVAPFFRGITLTISIQLNQPLSVDELVARYVERYEYEALVDLDQNIPLVRDAVGRHIATVGGFSVDATESHAVVVATLDNLLKGAATQALQNMNLTCGFDELAGLRALL